MIGQNQQKQEDLGNVQVFYSESSNVFYVLTKKHSLSKHFKSLINCSEEVFQEFLEELGQNQQKPSQYSFDEMKNQLDNFLIKRASV